MKLIKAIATAFTLLACSMAFSQTRLTVTHDEIQAPTILDHGTPGQSIGDMRVWQFPGKSSDGQSVTIDWIMTTTGVMADSSSEYRISSAVFSFGSGTQDQIVIQGVALYPSFKSTLDPSASTKRAITGGTGVFMGINGYMESKHLTNGAGWVHELYFK